MSPRQAVLDFFAANARAPLPTKEEELMACLYLDTNIIDSLGIVIMIAELEEKLGFTFSSEDMQSYDFQTVGGLIRIAEAHLAAR
jgi:acyl carrier protein